MSMSIMRLATMLSDDAIDRKSRHKRVPLITIIDNLGMNVGTFYEIRPEDMHDMLINNCNFNEHNSEVIDMIRDPSDEHPNLIDRNIIIRVKWPANSKVHKWSNDPKQSTKTRQDIILEQWPEASVDEEGILRMCPANVSANYTNEFGGCATMNRPCIDCRREFWLQKMNNLN